MTATERVALEEAVSAILQATVILEGPLLRDEVMKPEQLVALTNYLRKALLKIGSLTLEEEEDGQSGKLDRKG